MKQIINEIKELVKISTKHCNLWCWIFKIESAIHDFQQLPELIRMIDQEVKRYHEHYYVLNESLISDIEYDLLKKILGLLKELQNQDAL